jgi:hypothetical protein
MITLFLDRNYRPRASHSPYLHDLASSDFWFFAYLKGALQGSSFDEPGETDETDELLSAIQKILMRVDHETLRAVFEE